MKLKEKEQLAAVARELLAACDGNLPQSPIARLVVGIIQGNPDIRAAAIALRRQAGISQREISRRIEVRPATVSAFETGTNDMRLTNVEKYLSAVYDPQP